MIKMITCSFYNTLIDKEDAIPLSTMLQIDKARQEKIKFTIYFLHIDFPLHSSHRYF